MIRLPKRHVRCPRCGGAGKVSVYDGADLRTRREQLGLGLREVSRRLGFSAMYLSDVELGRRRVTDKLAQMYSDLRA